MEDKKTQTTKSSRKKWYVNEGIEQLAGPFSSQEAAQEWANKNIGKGKTYYLESAEDFL